MPPVKRVRSRLSNYQRSVRRILIEDFYWEPGTATGIVKSRSRHIKDMFDMGTHARDTAAYLTERLQNTDADSGPEKTS